MTQQKIFGIYSGKRDGFELFYEDVPSGWDKYELMSTLEVDTYELEVDFKHPLFRWSRTQLGGAWFDVLGLYAFSLDSRGRRGYHAVSFLLPCGICADSKNISQLLTWMRVKGLENALELKDKKHRPSLHEINNTLYLLGKQSESTKNLNIQQLKAFVKTDGKADAIVWIGLIKLAASKGYTDVYASAANVVSGSVYQVFSDLNALKVYGDGVAEEALVLSEATPPEEKEKFQARDIHLCFRFSLHKGEVELKEKGRLLELFSENQLKEIARIKDGAPIPADGRYGRERIALAFYPKWTSGFRIKPFKRLREVFKKRESIVAYTYYNNNEGVCLILPDERLVPANEGIEDPILALFERRPMPSVLKKPENDELLILKDREVDVYECKPYWKPMPKNLEWPESITWEVAFAELASFFSDDAVVEIPPIPAKKDCETTPSNPEEKDKKRGPTSNSEKSQNYISFYLPVLIGICLVGVIVIILFRNLNDSWTPPSSSVVMNPPPPFLATDDTVPVTQPDNNSVDNTNPSLTLTPDEELLLQEAIAYQVKAENAIASSQPDGVTKIFDRVFVDSYLAQLGSMKPTTEVVTAMADLNYLLATYHQNGYRKAEYGIYFHTAEPGETLESVAKQYGVTLGHVMQHNPRDIKADGSIIHRSGKPTVLVIYPLLNK